MRKHTHVYYEACTKMLMQSKHKQKFEKVFDFDELTRLPEENEIPQFALNQKTNTKATNLEQM